MGVREVGCKSRPCGVLAPAAASAVIVCVLALVGVLMRSTVNRNLSTPCTVNLTPTTLCAKQWRRSSLEGRSHPLGHGAVERPMHAHLSDEIVVDSLRNHSSWHYSSSRRDLTM